MNQNYINHMAFIIDESWSMSSRKNEVISILEKQIAHLAQRSKETDQETRVSFYQFNSTVKCTVFDKDVLRLPSIRNSYEPNGNTALIDATLQSISDLEKTNTLYGDHSFLCIVLSDGGNNVNNHKSKELSRKISSLPDNWTVAVLVPDLISASDAKKFGFPAGNVQVWDTNKRDMSEIQRTFTSVTDNYMKFRSTGQRGTKNLFQVNTSNLVTSVVTDSLDKVSSKTYKVLDVKPRQDGYQIRDFIEESGYPYNKGCAFYELTKTELIQSNKQVAVQNRLNGNVYSGSEARDLLGLPNFNAKVASSNFTNYRVFVQSNSVNRKLVSGTKVLYFV